MEIRAGIRALLHAMGQLSGREGGCKVREDRDRIEALMVEVDGSKQMADEETVRGVVSVMVPPEVPGESSLPAAVFGAETKGVERHLKKQRRREVMS